MVLVAQAAVLAAAARPEAGNMKNNLSEHDKRRISTAIANFEKRTSGELVGIIANSSDDYSYIPILWAALTALILPAFYLTFAWPIEYFRVYEIQMAVFAALALLFSWVPIKFSLVPRKVKQTRAARLARQEFLTLGLHSTKNRAAVLIFVSLAEHYIEILADEGINKKVPIDHWEQIVTDMIIDARNGRLAEGFLHAIQRCGDTLETHFPPGQIEQNVLPNDLIEI